MSRTTIVLENTIFDKLVRRALNGFYISQCVLIGFRILVILPRDGVTWGGPATTVATAPSICWMVLSELEVGVHKVIFYLVDLMRSYPPCQLTD